MKILKLTRWTGKLPTYVIFGPGVKWHSTGDQNPATVIHAAGWDELVTETPEQIEAMLAEPVANPMREIDPGIYQPTPLALVPVDLSKPTSYQCAKPGAYLLKVDGGSYHLHCYSTRPVFSDALTAAYRLPEALQ